MNNARNPFTASLGTTPPVLVGRSDMLDDFEFALDNGPGTHERISVVTGLRGVGKSVLLNAFEDLARTRGWIVVSETATSGFVGRVRTALARALTEFTGPRGGGLRSIQMGGWGVSWESGDAGEMPDLRTVWTALDDALLEKARGTGRPPAGVLVTLDELHHLSREEIIEFATTVQHLVREGREVAVAMAGIPSTIRPLLSDSGGTNPITFLRRASQFRLGRVNDADVVRALAQPLAELSMAWTEEGLEVAVAACGGYPFLIQLVGQQSVRSATGGLIDGAAAATGSNRAKRMLGRLVHEPALADLSDVDRTYLAAMAVDDGPSRVADIAGRMDVNPQYANNYRRRLIDAEIIEAPRRGFVDFTVPYLRDYLREYVATDLLGDGDITLGSENLNSFK